MNTIHDDARQQAEAEAGALDRLEAIAHCRVCDADGYVAGGEDGDPIAATTRPTHDDHRPHRR
jgi:hypothetical protein